MEKQQIKTTGLLASNSNEKYPQITANYKTQSNHPPPESSSSLSPIHSSATSPFSPSFTPIFKLKPQLSSSIDSLPLQQQQKEFQIPNSAGFPSCSSSSGIQDGNPGIHPPSSFNASTSSFYRYQPSSPLMKNITSSYGKFLYSLTIDIVSTYRKCDPSFGYSIQHNPRRVLTKPSNGVKNNGFDNADSDYILYVNDILGDKEGQKYLVLDVLGQGTFGQVVKCRNLKTREIIAVKVIKNKPAYFNQSMMEVSILELLNNRFDPEDRRHIVRMLDTFVFRKHLCLVFELLNVNLYELIKQNQFRGLSLNLVRKFTSQILNALCILSEARLIHCDLKPENILLKNLDSPTIKVIDFGSACHEQQTVYTYIQSRFYRSPEVLLGLAYSSSIDMWSLGCIVVELFLGLPIFPGSSEFNQITRIVEMLGYPPHYMLEFGRSTKLYFEKFAVDTGKIHFRLKSLEQFNAENSAREKPSKRYFTSKTLRDLIYTYPIGKKENAEREMHYREIFYDFVSGILNVNPLERWSPQQARLHPFITNQTFLGPFTPPMEFKGRPRESDLMPQFNVSESLPSSPAVTLSSVYTDSPHQQYLHRSRPRASTISSANFGGIPPQLQKIAALNSGNGNPELSPYKRLSYQPQKLPSQQQTSPHLTQLPHPHTPQQPPQIPSHHSSPRQSLFSLYDSSPDPSYVHPAQHVSQLSQGMTDLNLGYAHSPSNSLYMQYPPTNQANMGAVFYPQIPPPPHQQSPMNSISQNFSPQHANYLRKNRSFSVSGSPFWTYNIGYPVSPQSNPQLTGSDVSLFPGITDRSPRKQFRSNSNMSLHHQDGFGTPFYRASSESLRNSNHSLNSLSMIHEHDQEGNLEHSKEHDTKKDGKDDYNTRRDK